MVGVLEYDEAGSMVELTKSARVRDHGHDSLHYFSLWQSAIHICSTYIAIAEELFRPILGRVLYQGITLLMN